MEKFYSIIDWKNHPLFIGSHSVKQQIKDYDRKKKLSNIKKWMKSRKKRKQYYKFLNEANSTDERQ